MEQQVAELLDVVTLPVLDPGSQLVHGQLAMLPLDGGIGLLKDRGGRFNSGGNLVLEMFLGVASIAELLHDGNQVGLIRSPLCRIGVGPNWGHLFQAYLQQERILG